VIGWIKSHALTRGAHWFVCAPIWFNLHYLPFFFNLCILTFPWIQLNEFFLILFRRSQTFLFVKAKYCPIAKSRFNKIFSHSIPFDKPKGVSFMF
jgi:hypothetical protein